MISTIRGRMLAFFAAFALLVGAIVTTTVVVLRGQADDGLIINLAGRQRMLTQKMSKESLQLANAAYVNEDGRLTERAEKLRQTMRVFEKTLFALRDGGPAPLDLDMSHMRESPPAGTTQIRTQLDRVVLLWKEFKGHLNGVLSSGGRSQNDIEEITSKNVPLLQEMNLVVNLMQEESEAKILRLYFVQGGAFLVAVCLLFAGAYVARVTISRPIQRLTEAAQAMSLGNLDHEVNISGAEEIDELSRSFDRMRSSMLATMDSGMMGRAAGMDDF